jgi:hypothetical protein
MSLIITQGYGRREAFMVDLSVEADIQGIVSVAVEAVGTISVAVSTIEVIAVTVVVE